MREERDSVRKFHETERNLKFEQRLADIFAEHWGMEEKSYPRTTRWTASISRMTARL